MKSIVRKALLAGLGAVLVSEEAAKKVLHDLVKKGEMNEKEAKEVIGNLVKKVQKGKADLAKKSKQKSRKLPRK